MTVATLGLTIYSIEPAFWLYSIFTLCVPGFNPLKSTVTLCDDDCFAIYKSVLLPINVISTVSGNPSTT